MAVVAPETTPPPTSTPRGGDAVRTPDVDPPIDEPIVEPETDEPSRDEPGHETRTEQLNLAIIDVSKYRREAARDEADRRLAEETSGEGKGFFRGMLTKMWKGTIARDYYLEKYAQQAEADIAAAEDIYVHKGGRSAKGALAATVDRFVGEYETKLRSGAGWQERRNSLGADNEQAVAIKNGVKSLLKEFSEGIVNEATFYERKNELLIRLAGQNPELFDEGQLFADNLLDIAQNVKFRIEHGDALDEIMQEMVVTTGEAKLGQRTEARQEKASKLYERLRSRDDFKYVKAATVALATAATIGTFKVLAQKSAARAMMLTGVLGAGGALLAGRREAKTLRSERAQHMRDMAEGKEITQGSKRRQQLESTRYETVLASEAIEYINNLYSNRENQELKDLDDEEYKNAVMMISALVVRDRISDRDNVDFISYSSADKLEQERLDLEIALATIRVRLEEAFSERGIEGSFDELFSSFETLATTELEQDVSAKDKTYRRIRNLRVAKAAAAGTGMGIIFGLGIQEAVSHMPVDRLPFIDNLVGMGEDVPATGEHYNETLMHGVTTDGSMSIEVSDTLDIKLPTGLHAEHDGNSWHILDSDGKQISEFNLTEDGEIAPESMAELNGLGVVQTTNEGGAEAYSGPWHTESIGDNEVKLPEGYTLEQADGGFSVIDGGGNHAGEIIIDQNTGALTQQSIDTLKANGFEIYGTGGYVSDIETVSGLSQAEFSEVQNTVNIETTKYWTNDTRVSDLNELGLDAGGVNNTWHDEAGNVVVKYRLSSTGSFSGSEDTNIIDLVENGQFKTILTAGSETAGQGQFFDVEVVSQTDGYIELETTIPADSDWAQLFESNPDGSRAFHGGIIRGAQLTGDPTSSGAVEVYSLNTFRGLDDASNLSVHVQTTTHAEIIQLSPNITETHQVLDYTGFEIVEADRNVVPVVPLPAWPRTGLEAAKFPERAEQPSERYFGVGSSPEEIRQLGEEISPRLRDNPRAELNTGQELAWYREQLKQKRNNGERYLETMDAVIADRPELSELPADTRAIVTIPVNVESDGTSVYQALSLYSTQSEEALNKTTIFVYGYYPNTLNEDESSTVVEDYLSEIERFKADHPHMHIAAAEEPLPTELSENPENTPGYIGRHMYDIAMLSVERAIREGRMEADQEVLLVRNDVDQIGMSLNYLERMLDANQEQTDSDVFVGSTHWNTRAQVEAPGLGVVTNFKEIMDALSTRRNTSYERPTSGENMAVRMSTLAAVGGLGFGDYMGPGSDDMAVGWRVRRARGARSSTLRHVALAQIDTVGRAVAMAYRRGESVTAAIRPSSRKLAGSEGIGEKDNPYTDEGLAALVSKIERSISDMAADWYQDPALISAGLGFLFPYRNDSGEKIYNVRWHNGRCQVRFTDEGKEWLKNRLTRNSRGQFDTYGRRKRRWLYNKIPSGSNIEPQTPPRMNPAYNST